MLKIAHLVTGFAALLLSAVPGLSTSFLTTPDAIYLALIGLFNLLAASQQQTLPTARQQLLGLSSALLILAVSDRALINSASMAEQISLHLHTYPTVML